MAGFEGTWGDGVVIKVTSWCQKRPNGSVLERELIESIREGHLAARGLLYVETEKSDISQSSSAFQHI